MDAYTDPLVEEIVWVASSQVGKTQTANNILGYIIDQNPGPVLVVQPTIEAAESWSKDRLAPMLRDTPCFHGKVADPKARNSGNTILHKQFPGGHLTAVGANAPTGLAMRPIRDVIADEVDRFPLSAGSEGDPVSLAKRRTETFWNRKIILISTPTVEGMSAIWAAYEQTDQRRYWVPCPDCGEYQTLVWSQVRWDEGRPDTAVYVCAHCGSCWDDATRARAVARGEWRAGAPFTGKAGFHISALYSRFVRLADKARDFVAAGKAPEKLKVFVNTVLGECFAERGDAPEWQRLYDRREAWAAHTVPAGGLFLTAGVDVQKDRIEMTVWAWGRGKESWAVEHIVLSGETSEDPIWGKLTEQLGRTWPHESGAALQLQCMAVDSGYATTQVYAWARKARDPRIMVIKGQERSAGILGQPGKVDVTASGKKKRRGVSVWPVGVSILKFETYGWLRLDRPTAESGDPFPPGFVHIPDTLDEEWIKQLVGEDAVTKVVKGFKRTEWVKNRERNEALDCRIYARAAAARVGLDIMSDDHWDQLAASLAPPEPTPPPTATPVSAPPAPTEGAAPRRNGMVGLRPKGWLKGRR